MADLSCGMKCLKYLLFAFNFVFWICGIVIFGVGIWSRIKAKDFDSLLGDAGSMASAANIMIAAGIFVMVIGFVGCCGAWKENRVLLVVYFILLLLIFVLEIAAGILAYRKKDELQAEMTKNIQKVVDHDYQKADTPAQKSLTKAIDWFQKNVDCCGTDSADEWMKSEWYARELAGTDNTTTTLQLVPKSCCIKEADGCNVGTKGGKPSEVLKDNVHITGCVPAGKKFIKGHLWEIGGAGVGIAFIQIIGMVFSICLCRSIGYEKI